MWPRMRWPANLTQKFSCRHDNCTISLPRVSSKALMTRAESQLAKRFSSVLTARYAWDHLGSSSLSSFASSSAASSSLVSPRSMPARNSALAGLISSSSISSTSSDFRYANFVAILACLSIIVFVKSTVRLMSNELSLPLSAKSCRS